MAGSSKEEKVTLMTSGSITKHIIFFALPLVLGNLLQQLYNTVDSVMIGNYVGRTALAGVGASATIIYLLIAFSQGASVGVGVLVAQYLGAGRQELVEKTVHTAVLVGCALGVLLSLGGVVFCEPLLVLMQTPADILPEAALYLQIFSAGLLFTVLYNIAAGILNAAGNSRRSLIYLAIASVVHIVLDILFIPLLQLGVTGAALATVLSELLSAVLTLRFLLHSSEAYKLSLRKLQLAPQQVREILRIGLPTGFQNIVIALSNIMIQVGINGFGAAAIAGFGIYLRVDGFNVMPIISMGLAVTTFIGQNYGAGLRERAKQGLKLTVLLGVGYTLLLGALLLFFADEVLGLFTSDADVIAYGSFTMWFFCPFYWLLSLLQICAGAVRGTGKSLPPTAAFIFALCIFRIFWILLVLPQFNSLAGLMSIYPVSWFLGAAIMVLYVWKAKWL